MNICITPASIKNFGAYFKREIPSVFTNEKSSKALLTDLFNKALSDFGDTQRNRELILQHLSIAPQVLLQHIGNTPAASKSVAVKELQELAGKIVESTEDKSNKAFQNVLTSLGSMIGQNKVVADTPAEIRFDAVSNVYAKTFNQEVLWNEKDGYKGNALDPTKAFEFAVQRQVLKSQNKDGLAFKLVLKKDLPSMPNTVDTNPESMETVVMILVNKEGKPATFNEDGTTTTDGSGKVPVFQIRSNEKSFSQKLDVNTEIISKAYKISKAEARVKAELELKNYVAFINNSIADVKAGNEVMFDVDLGLSSFGFFENNAHKKTSLSEINNLGDTYNDARVHITVNGSQRYPEVSPAETDQKSRVFAKTLAETMSDNDIDMLHKLITVADLKLNNSPTAITKAQRLGLIGFYINPNEGKSKGYGVRFILDIDKQELRLNNNLIKTNELTKEQLVDFINSKFSEKANVTADPTNLSIHKSFEDTTGHDQFFKDKDGSLAITRMPVRNFSLPSKNPSLTNAVTRPTAIENGIIKTTMSSVHAGVLEFGMTQIIPTAEGRLQAFGSALAFKPTAKAQVEKAKTKIKPALFRTLADINSTEKDTSRQEEAADSWFRNSPLSQVLKANYFDRVHEQGPSFVAEFVNGAINLYLGSNKSDVYHEAFHAFTQAILSKEERDAMYNSIRKAPGKFTVIIKGVKKSVAFSTASDLEVEEYLAEEFRKFAKSKGKYSNKLSTRIAQFFEKLLNMLHGIFGKNMTYNEARVLNKVQGVVNTMFNNLYEGNIDVAKFNPAPNAEALHRSIEVSIPDVTFSLGEMKTAMESMQSLFSDFVKLGLNSVNTKEEQAEAVGLLLHFSQLKEDSEDYEAFAEDFQALENSKTLSGYGVFQIQKNPKLLVLAATYIKNRLSQQLDLFPADGTPTNEYNHALLTKILDNFGKVEESAKMINAEKHKSLLSLFLNEHSGINLSALKSNENYDEPTAEDAIAYGMEGTEKTLFETTDEQTKQLLSSIAAYTKQGKGLPQANILGVKKLVPLTNMIAKTARLLRNIPDASNMHAALVEASKKDKEFQQLLQLLGDLNNQNVTSEEVDQWTAFWQVFNKPDVFLRKFMLEKSTSKDGEVSYTAKSGKTSSQSGIVKRDWTDNFAHTLETANADYVEKEGDVSKLNIARIAMDYNSNTKVYALISGDGPAYITDKSEAYLYQGTSKYSNVPTPLATADPITYLKQFGINLADDPIVRQALKAGDTSIGLESNVFDMLNKSLINRASAITEEDMYVSNLNDLFGKPFYYEDADGKTQRQEALNGAFTKIQELHYTYSNDFTNFTAYNAEGELQSEKPFNSSLTSAVAAINNASTFDDLINTPGMEFLSHDANPFAMGSNWLVEMFQLQHPNIRVRGTRVEGMKLVIENLSGSEISNVIPGENTESKGIASIKSDELTKFITDFHLTLEGKQEILRSEAKSTSLTVYLSYQLKDRNTNDPRKGRNLIINANEVEEIFSKDYKGNLLYDQFQGQVEAELVRIQKLEAIKKGIINDDPAYANFVFDVAYLNRGTEFQMFDDIFTPALKAKLLKLGVSKSFEFNAKATPEIKAEIEKALVKFFKAESDALYKEKNDALTIADDLFKEYSKGEEVESEDAADVRIKMFRAFTINNFLQNANYSSIFIGDSALHNVEKEDYHKRIAGMISTGKIFRHDDAYLNYLNSNVYNHNGFAKKHVAATNGTRTDFNFNGYLETGVIKEKVTESKYAAQYAEQLGIDNSEYKKMKEADGAGWIGFDAYRTLNKSCGEWSDGQEALYQKMLAGEPLTKADMKATFPVRKFQYYGPVSHSDTINAGLTAMAFHKYSLMPLIPALIEGTPLEKVHNQMMEQGVDYITMQSGSKVSSLSKVKKVTDKDGKVTIEAAFDDVYDNKTRKVNNITFTKNTIHVKYLKNQIYLQEGFKGKITLPTQLRKIALLGFYDNGVPKDYKGSAAQWNKLKDEAKKEEKSPNYKWFKEYSAVIADIQVHLKNELLEDVGLDLDLTTGKYSGDSKKLVSYLKNQMSTGELLPEEIEMISDENGNIIEDLSFSLQSAKIEQILVSLVDKKLRRLKFNGEALVQVANTMFHEDGANFTNPTEAEIKKYGSNGLKFYERIDSETGESYVSSMEVKIALQGDYLKLLKLKHPDKSKIEVRGEDGKVDIEASRIRLNEAIKNESWKKENLHFLQFAGVRIPTQGPNALDACQVAEFLPEYAGGIVILPAEIVAKSGADYDIDKMFFLFKNIVNIDGKVSIQEYSYQKENKKALLDESESFKTKQELIQKQIESLKEDKMTANDKVKALKEEADVEMKPYHDAIADLKAQIKELNEISGEVYNATGAYEDYTRSQQISEHAKLKVAILERVDAIKLNQDDIDLAYQYKLEDNLTPEEMAELSSFDAAINAKIEESKLVRTQASEVEKKLAGVSVKGLENKLHNLIIDKVLNPSTFDELVTANTTDDILPTAKVLERAMQKQYSKYARYESTRPTDKISNTTIFKYRYNLSKHQENSVGMESLGIAAIASTFYAVFNTYGAVLNGASESETNSFNKAVAIINDPFNNSIQALEKAQKVIDGFRNYTLRVNHNKVTDAYGDKISLGFAKNVSGKSISDLLSQLINGYVDVAKDAWVFNIQGNKQNTPTLLFMVMAGIDINTAIFLSSNPLVVEYNAIKKEMEGVFSNLSTDDSSPVVNAKNVNNLAKKELFDRYKELLSSNGHTGKVNPSNISSKIKEDFREGDTALIKETLGRKDLSIDKKIVLLNKESELFELVTSPEITWRHMEALAHYMDIEGFSDDLNTFTQLTKFDTTKIDSISDAEKRINDTTEFKERKTSIPDEWFEKIKNTPIGLFNNDKFIVDLFEQYFELRNNPALIKYSLGLKIPDAIKGTDPSVVRTDYKNDFLLFLYQNSRFKEGIYNNMILKESADANAPFEMNDGVITYGVNLLTNDLKNGVIYDNGLEPYFKDEKNDLTSYVRYLTEYQLFQNTDLLDDEFRKMYEHLSYDFSEPRGALAKKVALYKSDNIRAMFDVSTSYASMFKKIKTLHPDLEKHALIADMRFDYDNKNGAGNRKHNMWLPQIKEVDLAAVYKEDLTELKNSPYPEVADFFKHFEHMAILQTGMNRRSKFDLAKLVDQTLFERTIKEGIGMDKIRDVLNHVATKVKEFAKTEEIKQETHFLNQYDNLFNNMLETSYRQRVKGYSYEVSELEDERTKALKRSQGGSSNVEIFSKADQIPDGEMLLVDMLYEDIEESSPQEVAEALVETGKKVYILNEKIIAPEGQSQADLDVLLLNMFGIDNSKSIPTLKYVSRAEKGKVSLAGVSLKPKYGFIDNAMANASTKAIGQATIMNTKYNSASQSYTDVLSETQPEMLATTKTKFKKDDVVWVFGSGIGNAFERAYENTTLEKYSDALNNTFKTYHKPMLDKAIKAGVSKFNVGTAEGMDKKIIAYLTEKGFEKRVVYLRVGKYFEMVNTSKKYIPVNINELGLSDLSSALYKNVSAFNKLSEDELITGGLEFVKNMVANAIQGLDKITNPRIGIGYSAHVKNRLKASNPMPLSFNDSLFGSYVEQVLTNLRSNILAAEAAVESKKGITISQASMATKVITLDDLTEFTDEEKANILTNFMADYNVSSKEVALANISKGLTNDKENAMKVLNCKK